MLLWIFSNPILCCLSNDYRLQMAPKMTPVLVNENELMVWFDFQPSLDAFFEDLVQDLSTKKSIQSYAFKNFSIVNSIAIGNPSPKSRKISQAVHKNNMEQGIGTVIDQAVMDVNNQNIIQPLVNGPQFLANFNPCIGYKNASMLIMSIKENLPWLFFVFDTIADERCENGTIPREQIDQECILLDEKETINGSLTDFIFRDSPHGPWKKLHCENEKKNEMNIFMWIFKMILEQF